MAEAELPWTALLRFLNGHFHRAPKPEPVRLTQNQYIKKSPVI